LSECLVAVFCSPLFGLYPLYFMTRKNRKNRKPNRRNGFKLSGRLSSASAEKSVVRRAIPIMGYFQMIAGGSGGSSPAETVSTFSLATIIPADADFGSMSQVYAQARLARLEMHWTPYNMPRNAEETTQAFSYGGFFGCIAFDTTSDANLGLGALDYALMTPHQLWSSASRTRTGFNKFVFQPRLQGSQGIASGNKILPGQWFDTTDPAEFVGRLIVSGRTQDNQTIAENVTVLQVIMLFTFEFRYPITTNVEAKGGHSITQELAPRLIPSVETERKSEILHPKPREVLNVEKDYVEVKEPPKPSAASTSFFPSTPSRRK